MRIFITGNVYSIHLRRWASYFASQNEVYIAYIPQISTTKTKALFQKDIASKIHLIPLVPRLYSKLIKAPNYVFRKILRKKFIPKLDLIGLKKAINKVKPDILEGHYLPDYGWLASQTGFHPLVLFAWGMRILPFESNEEKQKILSKIMFEKAELITSGDEAGKRRLIEFGCNPNKIFVQPWGVDIERFSPSAKSEKLRQNLLGSKDGYIVTLIRGLEDYYDISTLIKAIPIVLSENRVVKFVIIGEGIERKNLENLTKKLGIGNSVIFLGSVPHEELHPYLASSDIYVDTFHINKGGGGIGVAPMEAMSSGLPMVVANRPGVEAGVKNGYNGYIFEGGNSKDLAEKILSLFDNETDLIKFGKRSRELALRIGDWNKNMKKLEKIYHKITNN